MPRNDPARQPAPGDARDPLRDPLGTDPPQQPPKADVGADEPQLAVDFGELEVVHPDHLCAVGVHDLLVQEVPCEAQRVRR